VIYNKIGENYSKYRRPDPRIVDSIIKLLALKKGNIIADIGAGTGSYSYALTERGFYVRAIEPSGVMQSQACKLTNMEWISGSAENIPLADSSVDGVIAILSFHHFADPERALKEMVRIVNNGPIVCFTFDPRQAKKPWLADYFPEIWKKAFDVFPPIEQVTEFAHRITGRYVQVSTFKLPRDLVDYFAGAGWLRPEMYLDSDIRAGMSAFALADELVVNKGLQKLKKDLQTGVWEEKYGWLKELNEADLGYRFIKIMFEK
jgi:ubiquinone/menaquinone biosynthesis C-methylase UbiE